MRRSNACKAAGLGLGHGAEVVPAVRALLLEVKARRGEVLVAEVLAEHGTVGFRARRFDDAQPQGALKGVAGPCSLGCR